MLHLIKVWWLMFSSIFYYRLLHLDARLGCSNNSPPACHCQFTLDACPWSHPVGQPPPQNRRIHAPVADFDRSKPAQWTKSIENHTTWMNVFTTIWNRTMYQQQTGSVVMRSSTWSLPDIAVTADRSSHPMRWKHSGIVPNKSTEYLYTNKQFWNKIEQRIHAPNLLRMTQESINQKVVYLYPANNTHFSTGRYLLMGEMIYKSMIESQWLIPASIPDGRGRMVMDMHPVHRDKPDS